METIYQMLSIHVFVLTSIEKKLWASPCHFKPKTTTEIQIDSKSNTLAEESALKHEHKTHEEMCIDKRVIKILLLEEKKKRQQNDKPITIYFICQKTLSIFLPVLLRPILLSLQVLLNFIACQLHKAFVLCEMIHLNASRWSEQSQQLFRVANFGCFILLFCLTRRK